ncbi:MAG: MMPL family transporter, partial [Deltaproteobacteria bacterium]|nr:MMPL family transporter [Deltaproteobacteria bacterium]
ERFADRVIRLRWFIVVIVPVIVFAMMGVGAKNFGFEGSYRIWFGEESEYLINYDNFRATFGTDEVILITFKDDNGIFNKKALGTIQRITDKLWQTKYIARVDSITNYQYVHASKEDPDDILVDDFIEDVSALSESQLNQKKKIATSDVQTRNLVISEDGKTAVIMARLVPLPDEDPSFFFELRGLVESFLNEETAKTGYRFYLNGGPIITTEFITIAMRDSSLLVPIVTLAVVIFLILVFRKLSGSLIPILVVIFTYMFVLAVQFILGFKLNNITANLPVFVIAIGIADAVHIYWVWLLARRHGKDNHEAIHIAIKKTLLPAFLTSVTTFVGFISLAPSPVVPIKTLGIASASAAVVAFILSVTFLPAMLAIVNPKVKRLFDRELDTGADEPPAFAKRYSAFIIKHDLKIVVVTVVLSVFLALGLFKVQVDSEMTRYFREDSYINRTVTFIEKNITGPMTLEIVVDSRKDSGIKDPEFLKTVDRFYSAFTDATEEVRHMGSLLDVIKRFNRVMNSDNEEFYSIPESKNLIAQYLLLYSLSLPQGMEINDRMDVKERFFRITASMNLTSSVRSKEMIKWIEDWWADTPYSAKVNGINPIWTYLTLDITKTLIISISMAIALVLLVLLIAFRSVKDMAISIAPTVLPLALVMGIMGWLGIYVDIGIAMAGALIIGVAVDNAIHFLVKYREARKQGKSVKEALEYMITFAGVAMVFTTIVLSLSFSIFIFSLYKPNVNFGLITAAALAIALIAALLMLPAILSLTERKAGRDTAERVQ